MATERREVERWTPAPEPLADLPPAELARLRRQSRLGVLLIALGILGILWGVFHLMLAVGGPEQADFAHRQRYDEVKPIVQHELFASLVRSLAGLFTALFGGTLRRAAKARLHGRESAS